LDIQVSEKPDESPTVIYVLLSIPSGASHFSARMEAVDFSPSQELQNIHK
jgi:hypothetical protein